MANDGPKSKAGGEAPAAQDKPTISQDDLAQHIPIIRNYLRKIVRPSEIEDTVQTVLARALENLDRYRGDSQPRVWLLGIARNVGYEQARMRQRAPVLAHREHEDSTSNVSMNDMPEPTQEDKLGRKEEQALMLQALDGLSIDEKLALLVTYVDNVPGPDAAKLLGVSFAAFRQRLSRARQAMARELDKIMDGSAAGSADILAAWKPVLDPHGAKDDLKSADLD